MNFSKKIKTLFFLLFTTLFLSLFPAKISAETTDVPSLTFDYIYDSLEPFGTWYDIDTHGWVWQPNDMNNSWQPYTLGHWQLTEEGWLWQSNFDWGWLPFHYGKWYRHDRIGWCWVADYEWAPAWVTWYWTDNYVGWAPIPPVPEGESYEIDPNDWFFVSYDNFLSSYLINYRINYSLISIEVCEPYIIENNYYFRGGCYYYYGRHNKIWIGPPCLIVEKNVKRRVPKKKIVTVKNRNPRKRGGKKKVIEIYRPINRKKLTERIDKIEKLKKLNPTDKSIVPKAKSGKIDKNQNRKERKPNVHTLSNHNLPITPITKSPKAKKRTVPKTTRRSRPTPPRVNPPAPPTSSPTGNPQTQPMQLQPTLVK